VNHFGIDLNHLISLLLCIVVAVSSVPQLIKSFQTRETADISYGFLLFQATEDLLVCLYAGINADTIIVIYARVSSPTQNIANQREVLLDHCRIRGFQVGRIFEDTATGSHTARPGFQELIKYLHRGGYTEAVVVYKLDRLGRSLRDLLAIVDDLKQRNIGFISVSDNIDTTTAHGRLFFHLMASLSEYERDLIRDRCSTGKSQAIANGVKFGRPRKHIDINRVNEMLLAGIPKTKIAKKLNISYRCLTTRLKC